MNNKDVRVLFLNPPASLIKYGMYWGMNKIGCNAYLFQDEDRIFDKPQEYQLKKIEEMINKQKTNLIFCEGYGGMPIEGIINLCKKYGIQLHFWDIESPVTPGIALNMLDNCDFMWTTCIEYMNIFKEKGYKSDLLLFGCCDDIVPAQSEDRFKHDISIVGSNYDNRWKKVKEFVEPLILNNFDMKIYGLMWMYPTQPFNLLKYPHIYWNEHPQLPWEWLNIVINSSKIMVGLNCSDESKTQTSCRPFETLNCSNNSVYLAWYTKAQDKIFGEYIYQAKTGSEMMEMAKEILSMTNEQRQQKAELARNYVRKNHSYTLRAKQVVDKFFELGGL